VQLWITFAIVGLGIGALYASLGISLVVTYKGTGGINFATGALGVWGAFAYDQYRNRGEIVFPILGLPDRVHLSSKPSVVTALAVALLSSVIVGGLAHFLVFARLMGRPPLAKVVASIGVMSFMLPLVTLKFGSDSRPVLSVLPNEPVTIFGSFLPRDRLLLCGIVIVIGVCLSLWFRFAKTGLAISAASENEMAASFAGYSPKRLAGVSLVLSTLLATIAFVLASPITGLNPASATLFIVPALAVALIAGLRSIPIAIAAGLVLGVFQSLVTLSKTKAWFPTWAIQGANEIIPFLVIVVALFVRGRSLPTRGSLGRDRLPDIMVPRFSTRRLLITAGALAVVLSLVQGSWRFAFIVTMISTTIALSLVLLTGMVGQISLAQAAFAGASGFVLSRLDFLPFPLDMIVAALSAAVLGVLVGIPALRIRGAQLAVVSLAGAVAIEQLVFRNAQLTPDKGNQIRDPSLFGWNLGVRDGRNIARIQFALLVLVVTVLVVFVCGNVMRSTSGRRLLAVRGNERAAASLGINVSVAKLTAFALSSFIAGIGGALLGYSRGQLSADSFGVFVGITTLAFAYIAGITSVSGAIVTGTLVPLGVNYQMITRLVGPHVPAINTYYGLLGGVALVVASMKRPDGIAGAIAAKHRDSRIAKLMADRSSPSPKARVADISTARDAIGTTSFASEFFRPGSGGLVATEVSVWYGSLPAVQAMSLHVPRGSIVGLIGPNGAGKTTFVDALTGFVPFTGRVFCDGLDVTKRPAHARSAAGLARTWQSMELFDELTVRENADIGAERPTVRGALLDLVVPDRASTPTAVDAALAFLGLEDVADQRPSSLSLGRQKLVGVARALATKPAVLLLDEPAAGLDPNESREFGQRLREIAATGIAVLLIDHDMSLVLDVCDSLSVIEFGACIASGPPSVVREDQAVRAAYLGVTPPDGVADTSSESDRLEATV
jgi:ABC-type branched-subunit amino acid transport system ATPase component/ABC-type branched-subunit amino acid transport system permease subunit